MTQKATLLAALQSGRRLTTMDAIMDYGITRLAARIPELQREGYMINSRPIKVSNRDGKSVTVSEYWMS